MRRLAVSALVGLSVVMACKPQDPNRFETHVEKLKDTGDRAAGFAGLEQLVKSVVTSPNNKDRLQEFVDKVIPAFEEIWDTAPEQREQMLTILRDVGRPEAVNLWVKAINVDGSGEGRKGTLLALQGCAKAKASGCSDRAIEQLSTLIENASHDKGNEEGRIRLEIVETLGTLEDKKAVPVLIKAMEQTQDKQPVAVHRAAAKALGDIGDASAVDALITVTFRVPDSPSTTDIGNRSKLALVQIGEPAVDRVLEMLRGKHEEANKLAASHGVDIAVVKQTAAGILGAMGTNKATEELVAFMPKDDCGAKPEADPDPEQVGLRAFVANALGNIGDPAASEALCSCVNATHNPGDMWPITEALGRIGDTKAFSCLVDVVKNGEYNPEFLENSEFRHQIRWEGLRFAILAAKLADVAKVRAAMAANKDAKVKDKFKQWEDGIAILENCKEDKACYLKTLQNASAPWFAREKAAYEISRLAQGDATAAVEIAKAFKVRNPDARVTMAWLPAKMLGTKKCTECADALEAVIEGEKGSMDATMQLPVLTARTSIAKLD